MPYYKMLRLITITTLISLVTPMHLIASDQEESVTEKEIIEKKSESTISSKAPNKLKNYALSTLGVGAIATTVLLANKNDSQPFPLIQNNKALKNRCIDAYSYLKENQDNLKMLETDLMTIVKDQNLKQKFFAFMQEPNQKIYKITYYKEIDKLLKNFKKFQNDDMIYNLNFSYKIPLMNTLQGDLEKACKMIEKDQNKGEQSYKMRIAYYKKPVDTFKKQKELQKLIRESLENLNDNPTILVEMNQTFDKPVIVAITHHRRNLSLLQDTPRKYGGHRTKDLQAALDEVHKAMNIKETLENALSIYRKNNKEINAKIPIIVLETMYKKFYTAITKAKDHYHESKK